MYLHNRQTNFLAKSSVTELVAYLTPINVIVSGKQDVLFVYPIRRLLLVLSFCSVARTRRRRLLIYPTKTDYLHFISHIGNSSTPPTLL